MYGLCTYKTRLGKIQVGIKTELRHVLASKVTAHVIKFRVQNCFANYKD